MASDPSGLPYRPCVGIALIGPGGGLFAGKRIDGPPDAWQMPQGGIDGGEEPRDAALRELEEETGVAAARVEILRESPEWIPYDLPVELVPRLWGGRFRGQTQRWFAMRFLGGDDEIDIGRDHPEFNEWAWMPPSLLVEKIVPFKRATYARVLADFADLLGD